MRVAVGCCVDTLMFLSRICSFLAYVLQLSSPGFELCVRAFLSKARDEYICSSSWTATSGDTEHSIINRGTLWLHGERVKMVERDRACKQRSSEAIVAMDHGRYISVIVLLQTTVGYIQASKT